MNITPARNTKTLHWYHPELDMLRFGAFLMVFVFHSTGRGRWEGFIPGAYGVDLFFTLSAYLITEILLREQRTYGQFDLKAFYVRRILRIWPLYFTFLALAIWVAPLVLPNQRFPWPARLSYIFFLGNWRFLLNQPFQTPATILWSVSVEEQFYVTWPLLLRRWANKLPAIGAGLLILATLFRVVVVLLDKPPHIEFLWKATFSRLEPIVLGSLLAYFLRGEVPKLSTNRRWLLGAAGFGGLLLVGKFGATFGWRSLFGLPVAAICCTAILIAVLQPMSSTRPGPIQTVLVHLGRISYGLYVFHWAALQYCAQHIGVPRYPHVELLIRWGAAFMLTLVLAECSYWTIEKPFLKLKDRFSFVKADRKTPAENRSAETINAAANA